MSNPSDVEDDGWSRFGERVVGAVWDFIVTPAETPEDEEPPAASE